MLTRRLLLAGSASLLAAPTLHAARAPRTARVITLFDGSRSTMHLRAPNLLAWAGVMRDTMPDIVLDSGYDAVEFEAYQWSEQFMWVPAVRPLVPPVTLHSNACDAECRHIADILIRAAGEPTSGSTDIAAALGFGLRRCSSLAARNVVNFVTDDDVNRDTRDPALPVLQAAARAMGNTTVNGMVMGDPGAMGGYIREYIEAGPNSFTLQTVDHVSIRAAWERKFRLDVG